MSILLLRLLSRQQFKIFLFVRLDNGQVVYMENVIRDLTDTIGAAIGKGNTVNVAQVVDPTPQVVFQTLVMHHQMCETRLRGLTLIAVALFFMIILVVFLFLFHIVIAMP